MKFVCLTIFLTTSAIGSAQSIQIDPRSPVLGQANNRTRQIQIAPKELRCRGGGGLSVNSLGPTSSNEGAVLLMRLTFNSGSTPAASGLAAATCSFVERLVGLGEPRTVMFTGNRVMWIAGTLWEVPSLGSEWRPTFAEINEYLHDPNHYWSFMVTPGDGVWNAVSHGPWGRTLAQQASRLNTSATAPIAVAVGTDRSIIVIGGKHPSNKARATAPAKIGPSMMPMTTIPLLTATPNPVEIPRGQTEATTSIAWDSGTFGYCEIYWSADNGGDTELARGDKGTNLLITKLGSTYDIKMIVYVGVNGDPQEIARVTVKTRGSLITPGSSPVGQPDRRPNVQPYVFFKAVRVEPGATSAKFSITTAEPSQFYIEVSTIKPAATNSRISASDHLPPAFPNGAQLTAFTLPGASPTSTYHQVTLSGSPGGGMFQPNNTYHYVITAKAPDGNFWRYVGAFETVAGDYVFEYFGGDGGVEFAARCPERQLLAGLQLRGGDDVDSVRPLCATATGVANLAPLEPYPSKFGGEGGTDHPLICPAGNPVVIGMKIAGQGHDTFVVHDLQIYCGVADKTQQEVRHLQSAVSFFGVNHEAGVMSMGRFGASATEDQQCPAGTVGVGIHGRSGAFLDAVGLICGRPARVIGSMGKRRPPG